MADDDTLDVSGKEPPDPDPPADQPVKRGPGRPRKNPLPSGAQQRKQAATNLTTRLREAIDRVGVTIENRGDEELGGVIREDSGVMAGGLVNATRRVKSLRAPLLILLDVIEPVMAFGRAGGIVFRRIRDRRAMAMTEQAYDDGFVDPQAGPDTDGGYAGTPAS